MTQTENNKHKFTQSSTGLTLSEIEDGVDFPHTGLLKALLQTAKGNHVVKTGTGNANDDFAITKVNSTTLTVKGGSYYKNNKLHTITDSDVSPAVTLTLGFTTANAYHLLVINEAGQFAIRSPTAANKVANTLLNDVIVAVLTYTGASSAMNVQYLTNDKSANSLSIAHDNGGTQTSTVYTEVGEIAHDSATGGVKFKVTAGDLTIENDAADGDIIFKGNDADGTSDLTALTLDMSLNGRATFSGDVVSGGTTLTGGTVANEANNRITTSTGSNNNLNAEANLTFDGSTLAVTGGITGTTLTTTGLIQTTGNNIQSTTGSVTGVSIGAGTGGLSNTGGRSRSMELAADAGSGHGVTIHAHASFTALYSNPPIDCSKEEYYVGFDSQTDPSHNGVLGPNFPAFANPGSEFTAITLPNASNDSNGDVTTFNYGAETVFGGLSLFIGITAPRLKNGKEVVIHNLTGFGLYICVVDTELDPSQSGYIMQDRVNGGWHHHHSQSFFDGNDRLVELKRTLLGEPSDSQFNFVGGFGSPHSNNYGRDAIILKPRESVRLRAIDIISGEGGTNHAHDVALQQGLFSDPTGTVDAAQWMITSASSPIGRAPVALIRDALFHVPTYYTGTTFINEGTSAIVLPDNPHRGTQFAFLCLAGGITVTLPTGGSNITQIGQLSAADQFYTVGTSGSTSVTLSAGDTKTFVYFESPSTKGYQVIG